MKATRDLRVFIAPLREFSLLGAVLLLAILLAGCRGDSAREKGGFYGGDRPPTELRIDPASVPDAVPRREPLSATGNKPYTALGKKYYPMASARGYVKRGKASWYGKKFHGRRTSSGEPYDMFAMSAAHTVLPLPTYVRVTNLDNGKSVVVKVNDRGPFLHNRIIDLSYVAAHKLGIAQRGTGRVEVRAVSPGGSKWNPFKRKPKQTQPPSKPAETGTASIPVSGIAGDAQLPTGAVLLQVGAYSQPANASNMRQRLRRAGFQVVPSGSDAAGQVQRVRVGPFADAQAARAAQEKLESLLGHSVKVLEE